MSLIQNQFIDFSDTQNTGIVPNEIAHQSSSNKNSCSGAVSDHPNTSNEKNEKMFYK